MIFSDEKRFCLDGPDGYNYYWWDKRTEPRVMKKRIQGGGGIMIWGAFSSFGTTTLALIRGRMDSRHYQEVLRDHLLPYIHRWPNIEFLFVQDNAPIHVSRSTREWFDTQNVPLLPWPPIFCDCNPIENLWGDLSRVVYADGKQFDSVEALSNAIVCAWNSIPQSRLENLINSMPNRLAQVIQNRGGFTRY